MLSACHPDYARWYEKHNSVKRALQLEFEPTYDTFLRFFGKKEYREGRDGFSFDAWTGHVPVNQEGGMVQLSCGSPSDVVPNLALLYYPSEGPGRRPSCSHSRYSPGVMRAMVRAWEPDWAVAASDDFRDALSQTGRPGTFVGWLTYFSRQWGEVPAALPEPVRVDPVEDKGSLVVLGPEPLFAAHSEHLALGRRVQQFFEERGLLRPVVEQPPRAPGGT